jgi:hypothetical protein
MDWQAVGMVRQAGQALFGLEGTGRRGMAWTGWRRHGHG